MSNVKSRNAYFLVSAFWFVAVREIMLQHLPSIWRWWINLPRRQRSGLQRSWSFANTEFVWKAVVSLLPSWECGLVCFIYLFLFISLGNIKTDDKNSAISYEINFTASHDLPNYGSPKCSGFFICMCVSKISVSVPFVAICLAVGSSALLVQYVLYC